MISLIERRKQELTTEINQMMDAVQFFIDNKQDEYGTSISEYLLLNKYELNNVKNTLEIIANEFNPKSDSIETFENCKNQLEELQNKINKIQAIGVAEQKRIQAKKEAEQERKQRNSAAIDLAGTFAGIGATLGGIVLGCGGCMSCLNHDPGIAFSNGIPSYNGLTALILGVTGGAVIGAVIGAIIKRADSIALWLILGCIVAGIPILYVVYFSGDKAVNSTTSYDVPAFKANVTSFRFYEKGEENLPINARNYGHTFTKSKTRYVSWDLNLEYPQNRRRVDFTIKSILYRADSSIVSEQTTQHYVNSDWTSSNHSVSFGQVKFGNWQVGSYRIDLYINGKKIASGSFTVR